MSWQLPPQQAPNVQGNYTLPPGSLAGRITAGAPFPGYAAGPTGVGSIRPAGTPIKGFEIQLKPAVGQIWKVVGVFRNTLFSIGREFKIEEISETHYNSRWIDGGGMCFFNRETFLDGRCELVVVKPPIDLSRYPHVCTRCGDHAYVGIGPAAVDCLNADCPTKKR